MKPMIEVEGFCKVYGDITAVNGMNLAVRQGEIFGLLGPNGAGKTSTLECLEGLRAPSEGFLRVAGLDPVRERKKLRHLIGVQLQSAGMPENMTPMEAMRFFCAYHGVPPRDDLLERFDLTAKQKTPFHDLSTGQQRRLGLALALAHKPQVLFLDEPTAGLDVGSRAELHGMLREFRDDGTTVLLATHDMAEAEALSDRVAILLNGCLAATGTPLEITAAGAGLTRVSVQTKAAVLQDDHHALPAVVRRMIKDNYVIYFSRDIGQTVPALIDHLQSRDDELIDLRVERPSLEDRFLEITQ